MCIIYNLNEVYRVIGYPEQLFFRLPPEGKVTMEIYKIFFTGLKTMFTHNVSSATNTSSWVGVESIYWPSHTSDVYYCHSSYLVT